MRFETGFCESLCLAEYNPNKIKQLGKNAPLMKGIGYAIVLRDESGNLVDVVGNLDGNNSTREEPNWKMLNGITPKGFRTSIIRQYENGKVLDGTVRSSWFQAKNIRRTVGTYWGHPKDKGNLGWRKGGPLPVQLSSFRALRTDQGAVIKFWFSFIDVNVFSQYREHEETPKQKHSLLQWNNICYQGT